jgi:tetratricopeptide (TPR) repeat protein
VAAALALLLAVAQVPQAQRPVAAPGGELPPVRAEGHAPDLARVAFQRQGRGAAGSVAQAHPAVAEGRCQPGAVRAEGQLVDNGTAVNPAQHLTGGDIQEQAPGSKIRVAPPYGQPARVGTERAAGGGRTGGQRHSPHRAFLADQGEGAIGYDEQQRPLAGLRHPPQQDARAQLAEDCAALRVHQADLVVRRGDGQDAAGIEEISEGVIVLAQWKHRGPLVTDRSPRFGVLRVPYVGFSSFGKGAAMYGARVLGIMVLVLGVHAAWADPATDAFNKGVEAFKAKEYDKALAHLDKALELDPKNVPARYTRGLVHMQTGARDKALADFDEALRLDPKNVPTRYARGMVHIQTGASDKALADFDEALRLEPKNVALLVARGGLLTEQKQYDRALADLDQAIALEPKNLAAYVNRGSLFARKGEHARALANFERAVKLDSTDTRAWYGRALSHAARGEHDDAIADFTALLEINPKDPLAYQGRGVSWRQKGEHDKAVADFGRALEIDPKNVFALVGRGDAYLQKKDPAKAIADFTAALGIDTKSVPALRGRGEAHCDQRAYDKAVEDFRQALRLEPRDAETCNALAWLRATCPKEALRDGKEAVELARRACEASQWKDPVFLDTLAAACAEAGQFEEAGNWQKKALELATDLSKEERERSQQRLKLYESGKPYRDE